MSFEKYEPYVCPMSSAYVWRNDELARTDIAATVSDYPNAAAILVYREALRQWPARNEAGEYINGFPDTRPEVS